jgi:hypothetical protein
MSLLFAIMVAAQLPPVSLPIQQYRVASIVNQKDGSKTIVLSSLTQFQQITLNGYGTIINELEINSTLTMQPKPPVVSAHALRPPTQGCWVYNWGVWRYVVPCPTDRVVYQPQRVLVRRGIFGLRYR